MVAIFATTRSICPLSSAFPIMIELRQARLANMARAFGNLTISPGLLFFSATMDASSWTSSTPNCVPLLKGTAVIFSFFVVGSSSSTYIRGNTTTVFC